MDIHEQQREATWVVRRMRYLGVVSQADKEAQQRVDDSYLPTARKHYETLRESFFRQINALHVAIQRLQDTDFPRLDREELALRAPFEQQKAEAHKSFRIAEIPAGLMGSTVDDDTLEQRERAELKRLKAKYETG